MKNKKAKNNASQIGLILILIVVFPTLFFSAYELNTLNKNEQVVDSIYASQLKNIAASINQYSVDVVTDWANHIDNNSMLQLDKSTDLIYKEVYYHKPLKGIFFNKNNRVFAKYTDSLFRKTNTTNLNIIDDYLTKEDSSINRLKEYITNDYRKIQNLNIEDTCMEYFIFALKTQNTGITTAGLIISEDEFINEILAPKIQSLAQDHFLITIVREDEILYSNNNNFANAGDIRLFSSLWLVKNINIGIQIIDDPMEQMMQQRNRTNIILIIIMDMILLIGAFFVYRTLRQQMRLAQLKSEFVSNVSHEIKTPLALISMYSETLEMNRIPTEEKKLEYFRVINKESQRLMRMVNKILNFSKGERGTRIYNFVETDINCIVDRVIDTYKHHFTRTGFDYNVVCGENLPGIKADEEAIIDAISNLIDNAIKYSDENKSIEIRTGKIRHNVFVSIKDAGIGIKEKDQKHVFDKFYRVTDGNLAHFAKGSGIGLNIVKSIVETHNGKISLKSVFGKGSTFTINLPHL